MRACAQSGRSHVAGQSPSNESVSVTVPDAELGLEMADDLHVFLTVEVSDHPLPVRDRTTVLSLDRGKVCRRSRRPQLTFAL